MSNCVNKETCIEYARLGENTECYLCPNYKAPMSNADRIRAMDDKELAEFLMECNPANCQQCAFSSGWRCDPDREDYSDAEKCTEGRKRWLQQLAEEEQT